MRNHYYNNEELDRLASDDHPDVRKVVDMVRDLAGDLLFERMRKQAAQFNLPFDAGFSIGLWKALQQGPKRISEEDVTDLEQLSEMAGGWWTFDELGEPEFQSLDEWRKTYQQR
jgi:hypothetical protein